MVESLTNVRRGSVLPRSPMATVTERERKSRRCFAADERKARPDSLQQRQGSDPARIRPSQRIATADARSR